MPNITVEVTAKITEIEEQERRMRVVIGRLNDPLMINKFSEKLKALENEKHRLRTIMEQNISLDQMVTPMPASRPVTNNRTQVDPFVSRNPNPNANPNLAQWRANRRKFYRGY